ncbi:hypothetical protein L2V05_06190 [Staphylococcus aureus]|nr:hypothetical protein [Staphylococcus aureus]
MFIVTFIGVVVAIINLNNKKALCQIGLMSPIMEVKQPSFA